MQDVSHYGVQRLAVSAVGAASRWRVFLHSWWRVRFFFSLQSFRDRQKP